MSVVQHVLSVNAEDWSNVALLCSFDQVVPPWPAVVHNAERLLELFQARRASAT